MEAIEVTFDPRKISFEELLDTYWGSFPTWLPPGPSRVRTAVLTRGETQQALAEAAKRERRRTTGDPVHVEILPDAAFYPAERMHQKFYLRHSRAELVRELAQDWDGDVEAFLASTVAARLNAYLKGMAGEETLAEVAREVGWDVEVLRLRMQTEPP